MEKTAMLITVGVSLQENIWNKLTTDSQVQGTWQSKGWEPLSSKDDILSCLDQCYSVCYPQLKNQIDSCQLKDVDFPSAEIESFCYWLDSQKDRVAIEKIILLPTDKEESKECAKQVKKIIVDEVFKSRLVNSGIVTLGSCVTNIPICPFKLRMEDVLQFANDVATFLNMLEDEINKLKDGDIQRVILNITGGYKVLVSIFSLFGFLKEDVEIIYKHEDAEVLVEVPSLPLTWDFKLFDEYRSLLRGHDVINFDPPSKFKTLFEFKAKTEWVKSAFGATLSGIYEKERFKRFGTGARLIRRLKTDLQEKLEERIPRWEHVWIGDQIPETVEHSRGHSSRLLEYTADLLDPKFAQNPNFLCDEELYLLLCCLWLHDIGHTGLKYKVNGVEIPIGMFPTLVRNWHNFISYELIRNGDYLDDNEKEAVALLCKYDRGKLPLLESTAKWEDKVLSKPVVEPLEKFIQQGLPFRRNEIAKEKALLLCALLRVIDSCDLQWDRVIDENYWTERSKRTRDEVKNLWALMERRWELLELCDNSPKARLEKLKMLLECCKERWSILNNWEKAQEVENFVDNEIEDKVVRLVGLIYDLVEPEERSSWKVPKKCQKEIILDLLSLIDRMAFKMRQEAHFYKHSRMKLVYLTHNDGKYRINMIFDEKAELGEEQKKLLAEEIWKELVWKGKDDVKKILEGSGLEFDGVYSEGEKLMPGGTDE